MNPKLLIYIVSYQRIEYTKGTIMAINRVKPPNSQIIVCDNGSTDGTREWLKENQDLYDMGLLFPENNLRVGGAWTLLTQYYQFDAFDYILLLDNDLWMLPNDNWFDECLDIFNLDPNIGSLGIFKERKDGYFASDQFLDPFFKNKIQHNNREYFDTVYYAGGRLDKFSLWYKTMYAWPHRFIGDKIGRSYNSQGYRTVKLFPGMVEDISAYNFTNENHKDYNTEFYRKERKPEDLQVALGNAVDDNTFHSFVLEQYGEEYLQLFK